MFRSCQVTDDGVTVRTCSLVIFFPDLVISLASSISTASWEDLTWEKSRASVMLPNKDCLLFFVAPSSPLFFSSVIAHTLPGLTEQALGLGAHLLLQDLRVGGQQLCDEDNGRARISMALKPFRYFKRGALGSLSYLWDPWAICRTQQSHCQFYVVGARGRGVVSNLVKPEEEEGSTVAVWRAKNLRLWWWYCVVLCLAVKSLGSLC